MKADFDLAGTDVDLAVNLQKTAFKIVCQAVDQTPTGRQRSGKYIHLTLTTKQAMRLLSMLEQARDQLGLQPAPQASLITVPPEKDRN